MSNKALFSHTLNVYTTCLHVICNLLFLFIFLFTNDGFANTSKKNSTLIESDSLSIELLLSRLDLNREGLQEVNKPDRNLASKVKELLAYYKNRNSVKHPINQKTKSTNATQRDFKYANDAIGHIFVGQPAYPPHFCGKDIDWNSRPVPDMEWVWQLNRMYFWNAMGKVYTQSGDEKYASAWCEQLIDWVNKNPNDAAHKYAWRSIETGIRGYSWTGLFHQFISSPHFTDEVLVAFLNSCFDHAEFLMTKYRSNSNWGLMEAEGMAFIAITFPEFKNAAQWKTEAFRRLNNEINIQVYPDGQQRELAMGYHIGCIRWFLRTYELAKLNQVEDAFSDSYLEKIELMCEVPMKLCLPDGTNVQFGDAWAGTPGQHDEKFMEWANLFDREDFLFLATGGKEGIEPDATSYALKESGLYSMRSSWEKDAISLVLKCGPDGGGHCQPDNGTFDLYAGGRNLMPDAGSYIYSGDPENRAWFRQTKIHQTLTLDGMNTNYAPKLLQWKPDDKLDILVVENESYENLRHRRAVFFVDKRYVVIVDEAIGEGIGDVGLHFQLAPGEANFYDKTLSVNTDFREGWNVLVQTKKQKGLKLIEEEGQVSYEYTKKEPRPAFGYHVEKTSKQKGIRFLTLVVPYEGEYPTLKIKLLGKPEIGASSIQLEINENGERKLISYNLND